VKIHQLLVSSLKALDIPNVDESRFTKFHRKLRALW